jgi:hypothetical protein
MRRRHGSSVVELTLAIGLASFGMLAMTAMQVEAHRGSYRYPQADAIAKVEMEHLRALPWEELVDTKGFQGRAGCASPGELPATYRSPWSSRSR